MGKKLSYTDYFQLDEVKCFIDFLQYSDVINVEQIDFKDFLVNNNDWFLDKEKKKLEENCSFANIKKWIRYSTGKKDADIILKDEEIMELLKWSGNMSYEYLDCIFSFKTHFNMFLKMYEPRGLNHIWMLENIEYVFSESAIQNFCLINNFSKDIFIQCISNLEEFARITHTIGNYMPCPDNSFNSTKGFKGRWYFNDRLELLLEDMEKRKYTNILNGDTAIKWSKWFEENKNILLLSELYRSTDKGMTVMEELLKFSKHNSTKFALSDIEKFDAYLVVVNELIENRGKQLVERMIKNRQK